MDLNISFIVFSLHNLAVESVRSPYLIVVISHNGGLLACIMTENVGMHANAPLYENSLWIRPIFLKYT